MTEEFKLALLKTDYVNNDLRMRHGDLPDMFSRFVTSLTQHKLDVFDVRFELPPDDYRCDAFLISGSRVSVNDEIPWVSQLKAFIRGGRMRGMRFVGFCFGHQVIASAAGGEVRSSERGWNVGARQVRLADPSYFVDASGRKSVMVFNHGEQVVEAPPGADVLAGDEMCPIQMFRLGRWALGCQGHPEYTIAYQNDLMENNLALSPELRSSARRRNASMLSDDSTAVEWVRSFLKAS